MLRRKFIVKTAASLPIFMSIPSVMASSTDFDLKTYMEELRELVSIDSKSHYEEGVNKIAKIMADRFKSIGWTVKVRYLKGLGDMVIATNKPNLKNYDVIFSAHYDTVQSVGNAAKYPFRLKGNIAYGAGVADDKSSLNAVWWICKNLPADVNKKLNIAVLLNPGEETGSPEAKAVLMEEGAKAKYALVYEPGRPGNGCVRSRKGAMYLAVHFKGLAAHAGNNPKEGRNAIEAMALAIPKIKAVEDKYPDVTLNADIVKGGTTSNTIAEDAMVGFDFRFFNDKSRDAVLKDVEELCNKGFAPGVTATLKPSNKGSALTRTEKTDALIAIVDRAAKELGQPQMKWLDVGGASDGNDLSGAGATVVCGMGVVGGDLHHPEKEWSDMSTVKPRVELGRKILELMAKEKS